MAGTSETGGKAARDTSVLVMGKCFALLDTLAGCREATASELATVLGEPRSSVYRLLTTLSNLDIVEPGSQRGTYRLGLKLLRLGSAVVARLDVRLAAEPVMERLHDETGETVYLCVRRGRDGVCISRIEGRRSAAMELKVGGAMPLHAGAAPQALLAFERRTAWESYLDGAPLDNSLLEVILTREEIIERFEHARRTGVTVCDGDLTPGFAALGAPVYDHLGQVCAALSISGIRSAIVGDDAQWIEGLIRDGAREVSRAMGYDGARVGAAA